MVAGCVAEEETSPLPGLIEFTDLHTQNHNGQLPRRPYFDFFTANEIIGGRSVATGREGCHSKFPQKTAYFVIVVRIAVTKTLSNILRNLAKERQHAAKRFGAGFRAASIPGGAQALPGFDTDVLLKILEFFPDRENEALLQSHLPAEHGH